MYLTAECPTLKPAIPNTIITKGIQPVYAILL
jgi:hypothetical protein